MLAECNEPSSLVAFVGFPYDFVGYELALVRFSEALGHRGALVVGHGIDARPPRLDFPRIFGEVVLILARPGFGVGQQVAERFHHWPVLLPVQLSSESANVLAMESCKTPLLSLVADI